MRQTEACRAELVHRRAWLGGETAASGRAGVAAARGGVTTLLPGWGPAEDSGFLHTHHDS